MMRAFVFPGQGSQRKGMGRDLFPLFPELVRRADAILGYSIAELCLEDPRGQLNQGAFAQPAIFVVSMLAFLQARRALPPPDCTAGHSVGEYAALAAAQVFDFDTGLWLVAQRGALMAAADGGGLAAVVGLSLETVEELLAESGGLSVANINTPTQIVVGGPKAALDAFVGHCRQRGGRAVPLRVSGAFHTQAMAEAAERFREVLAAARFRPPVIPVACNLTGRLHAAAPDAGEGMADILARHIASPVRWSDCVGQMLALGVTAFEEIGGTRILTAMIEEIRQSAPPTESPPAPITVLEKGAAAEPRLLPDWSFPELASRAWCRCPDEAVAQALERLQALYLRPRPEGHELAALCRDDPVARSLLGEGATAACALSGPALRARLRALVRDGMRGRVFPDDDGRSTGLASPSRERLAS